MSEIGRNIMRRRKELGMTQEELAMKMGYKSKSTINKIENGTNDIPQSKIVNFAKVLETTPAYLMGWENKVEENPVREGNKLADWYLDLEMKDDDLQIVVEVFNKLDGNGKEQLKAYANFLLSMKEGK